VTAIGDVLPVIPTPFRDGEFDPESFQALLDHMIDDVDGYTLLGSTGEAPSMTVAERMEVAEAAIGMTPSEKSVVVGVTSTSIADTIALSRHAESQNARAVLCAAPFYFRNTPDGILSFLREVDAAIDIDIVLYDNPMATKTTIRPADAVKWASELENLRTIKLTDHEIAKVRIWQDAGLEVIGGDDPILVEYLAAGVDGAMMIAPAIFPAAFAEAWRLLKSGDLPAALEIIALEIIPFVHVFGIGREIATTKALLEDIGVFASGELRPPLEPVSEQRTAILRQAYDLGVAATGRRLAATEARAG
jgi:4-hydroxy-tetrahydrodipicolinate synthase